MRAGLDKLARAPQRSPVNQLDGRNVVAGVWRVLHCALEPGGELISNTFAFVFPSFPGLTELSVGIGVVTA